MYTSTQSARSHLFICSLFILILLVLGCGSPYLSKNIIDFEDMESGEKPDGWEFNTSGEWGVTHDGTRVLEQAKSNAYNCAAVTGNDNWKNYTVQSEIKIEQSGDGGVLAYWQSHYANYLLKMISYNRIELVKMVPTGAEKYNTVNLDTKQINFNKNVWYIFKLKITTEKNHTYLRGKIWEKGTSEQGTWMVEASDYSAERYLSGKTGVWTSRWGNSYQGAKFDNFSVMQ